MPKMLIVDDDPFVTRIYQMKFAAEGFDVYTANDGEAALKAINDQLPDAVLLDFMLPKLNGLEVLKRIRLRQDFRQIQILVFSNAFDSEVGETLMAAGANKVITKSGHTPKQIVNVVRDLLTSAAQPPAPAKAMAAAPLAAAVNPATPKKEDAAAQNEDDIKFEADLRKACLDGGAANVAELRQQLAAVKSDPANSTKLMDLRRKVHSIAGNSGLCGLAQLSSFASAMDAMIKDMQQKPETLTVSTLRTLSRACDTLQALFTNSTFVPGASTTVLIVHNQEIAQRVLCYGVEKAKLRPLVVPDPAAATSLLEKNKAGLIFLDVSFTESGSDSWAAKFRSITEHAMLPIVKLVPLADFEAHAASTANTTEIMAKPFTYMEVAVMALLVSFQPPGTSKLTRTGAQSLSRRKFE
jgi:DNA-binding response OmpR family regulator